jgi:hypothetical protein
LTSSFSKPPFKKKTQTNNQKNKKNQQQTNQPTRLSFNLYGGGKAYDKYFAVTKQ